jgi:hypothetical protein
LRQIGHHWLERLAWQAGQWGARAARARWSGASSRCRAGRCANGSRCSRPKACSSRRANRYEGRLPFDWPGLAAEEGFADQAHLVRAVKRITGFSPTVFTQRYLEDESFWLYRLWV